MGKFRQYFLEVLKAQEENKKLCGNCYNYEYDGYIFVDAMGNLIKPNYLSAQFPRFLEKHGLRRIRFHDLRHSCASLLLANSVPMKEISLWLGHSSLKVTEIYAHLDYSAKLTSSMALENSLPLPDSNFNTGWSSSNLEEKQEICVPKNGKCVPKISDLTG